MNFEQITRICHTIRESRLMNFEQIAWMYNSLESRL